MTTILHNKNSGSSFGFGLDQGQIVELITSIIDGINSGEIIVHTVTREITNEPKDFEVHSLTLRYAEQSHD